MFRNIFFLLLFLIPSLVFAQADIISPSNIRTIKQFKNYVQNPDAEKNVTDGVSGTMSVVSRDTSTQINGKGSFQISNSASGQKFKLKLNALPLKFTGQNLECSFSYTGNNANADFKFYVENSGGTKVSPDIDLPLGDTSVSKQSPLVFGTPGATISNPYYLVIESTVATIRGVDIDEVYCGDPTSIGQFSSISDPVCTTGITVGATTTAPTKSSTAVLDQVCYTRFGKWANIIYRYNQTAGTGGAAGSGTYLYSLPAGLQIDTTYVPLAPSATTSTSVDLKSNIGTAKLRTSSGPTGGFDYYVAPFSTTQFFVYTQFLASTTTGYHGSGAFSYSAGDLGYTFNIWVPIQGWSASQGAAAANQTDYGDTSFTPTVGAGAGTVTANAAFHSKTSEYLNVRGFFTTGTVAASLVTMTLPNSLSIDTAKISVANTSAAAGEKVGSWACAGSNLIGSIVTATGTSSTLVYFSGNNSSSNQLIPTNGSTSLLNTISCSYSFRVPISGWAPNQRSPTLIGSVTSNSTSKTYATASGKFYTTAFGTICSASPCATSDLDGATSVTRTSAGIYNLIFPAGLFGAVPSCTFNSYNSAAQSCSWAIGQSSNTATAYQIRFNNCATGGAVDVSAEFTCIGPR